jgi:uncharacterized protein YigE (DUF2233 family)
VRAPIGRIAVLVALIGGVIAIARSVERPHWRSLSPGVEFLTLSGEPFCRRGSSHVAFLRVDPARVALRVLHYTRVTGTAPLNIVEWQRRTKALAVFNAGQYYPDYSYMGLLVSGGEVVSNKMHPGFRAALVANPSGTGPEARVLDLEHESIDARRPGWGEVAQSFMLFDRQGRDRVRKSDQVANRTVVCEDKTGRLVIATSEGGYTLWEFAELLRRSPLQLSHAMAMDGGYEAELCVDAGRFRYASFGRWRGGAAPIDAPGAQVLLPAVVAVVERK